MFYDKKPHWLMAGEGYTLMPPDRIEYEQLVELLSELEYISIHPDRIWVRFQVSTEDTPRKILEQKQFLFSRYEGDPEKTLYQARIWRNKTYSGLLHKGLMTPLHFHPPTKPKLTSKNTSGQVGVRKRSNSWLCYWTEYESIDGEIKRRNKHRTWSIKVWGNGKAKELATNKRLEMEKYITGHEHLLLRAAYLAAQKIRRQNSGPVPDKILLERAFRKKGNRNLQRFGVNSQKEKLELVLDCAKKIMADKPRDRKYFTAIELQHELFPEEEGSSAVILGISPAITQMKSKGLIRGWGEKGSGLYEIVG